MKPRIIEERKTVYTVVGPDGKTRSHLDKDGAIYELAWLLIDEKYGHWSSHSDRHDVLSYRLARYLKFIGA